MTPTEFKKYYRTPTKLEKNTLNTAEILFCQPSCTTNCPNTCTQHPPARTLKTQYISNNQNLTPRTSINPPLPQALQTPHHPNPPPNIIHHPQKYHISTILDHKTLTVKDKYKITKKYTTYLCQWIQPNNITYNKWMPQRELFPLNYPTVTKHNLILLERYYTIKQLTYYQQLITTHFSHEINKDPRFIPPPTTIPLFHISIQECNPEKDIATYTETIQINNTKTHLYENTGRYLITIPTTRLEWLWQQYNKNKYNTHGLVPQPQSFEKEIIWLYQRYKHKTSKKNP